jgi:hypothetical protein
MATGKEVNVPPVPPQIASDQNRYWKDVVSRIFLRLKDKPKSGKQVRCLGGTKRGVWMLTRDASTWMRMDECWYVNVFVLQHAKLFNFNLCRLSGVLPSGVLVQGFFCPEYVLLKYAHRIQYRSYELQVEVHPEDLFETYEQAKSAYADLKAELNPAPQKELFNEASME